MSAIKKAVEMLRREAESMKECHTVGVGGEWYGDSAKADYDEMIAAADAAIAERAELLEALKEIMPFTATAAIGCHGEKCRESWCHSCNGEEEAEAAAQKGCDAWAKARAAIARATGEQP